MVSLESSLFSDSRKTLSTIIRERKHIPANGPVNVNKQTIHAIILGLDHRAAKQIYKLRRLTIIRFSIVIEVGFGRYRIVYLLDRFNIVTVAIVVIIT